MSGLPVAETLRVTEMPSEAAREGRPRRPVTRLRGFRQDIIDERAGVAGAHVMVEETGAPSAGGAGEGGRRQAHRNQLVATRGRAEGLIFNIDGLSTPSAVITMRRRDQLATRDAATKRHCPEGLNTARRSLRGEAPSRPTALSLRERAGDGQAGLQGSPRAARTSPQSLEIFKRLGDVQTRIIAVDERMGTSGCAWPGACASAAAIS